MTILGVGNSNGAISILHALGAGKGCSVGIDIRTTVTLLDAEIDVDGDEHGLLDAVATCWRSQGLPIPSSYGWLVDSEVPIGQGLKSSSSVACAALRALNTASWVGLSDYEIADLAVAAQRNANCTVTGSLDDVWASLRPGWKLVDPMLSASESVLLEGELEQNLSVLVGLRGNRSSKIDPELFREQGQFFERAVASLTNGSPLEALSVNGMAVAAATDDHEALRISNLGIAIGAIAAGITGSGPAMTFVCFSQDLESIQSNLSDYFTEVFTSNFSSSEVVTEEAHRWE